MIGDWVCDKNLVAYKIGEISAEGTAMGYREEDDDINGVIFADGLRNPYGIPLTRDILLKNDIISDDSGTIFLPDCHFVIPNRGEDVEVLEDENFNIVCALRHVHELQHLLRILYPDGRYKIEKI